MFSLFSIRKHVCLYRKLITELIDNDNTLLRSILQVIRFTSKNRMELKLKTLLVSLLRKGLVKLDYSCSRVS